ncbi:MAG: hypothetical protein KBA35_05025, partial [Flavobacterium sp.]|uniref:hypothetical protein n=1 Tax=Flavobacterium sp. TaxID=239 RepID=UPI001B625607
TKNATALDVTKNSTALDVTKNATALDVTKNSTALDATKNATALDVTKNSTALDVTKISTALDVTKNNCTFICFYLVSIHSTKKTLLLRIAFFENLSIYDVTALPRTSQLLAMTIVLRNQSP